MTATTGLLIPNGQQQFLDGNGQPLGAGFVYFYIPPSTTTPKNTWADPNLTILNPNPIQLNAGGWSPLGGIWGDLGDSWRQVVTDRLGNVIWDQVVSTPASSSASSFYDLAFYLEGLLVDGEVYPIFNVVRSVTLPIGLTASIFTIVTNPTAPLALTLKKNSTTIGTVTFSTLGAPTVSFLAPVILNPGDQFSVTGPNPHDVTGAGIAGTVVMTVN